MPLLPAGFGPGTNFSLEHTDFVTRMNSLAAGGIANGVPSPMLATRGADVIIKVDPNGDDSEDNDGTVTPLKTIHAALRRRPAIADGVEIQLAAGTYAVPQMIADVVPMVENLANNICFGALGNGLRISGAVRTLSTFKSSDITGNVITKNTGAAWVPGEHVGKRVNWIVDYYGYLLPQNFWIIDNGDHWIKVAWFSQAMGGYDPRNSFMPVVAATDINIQELASIISGDSNSEWPNVFGSDVTFHDLHYSGSRLVLDSARATFYRCRFSGCSGTSLTSNNGNVSLYSCQFDTSTTAMSLLGGLVYLSGSLFRTLTSAINARGTSITADNFAYASAVTNPLHILDIGTSMLDWQRGIWISSVSTLYRCKQANYQKATYGLKQIEAGKVDPTTVYQLQGTGNRLFLGGQTSNFAAQGSTAFIAGPVSSNTHAAFVAASKLFSDNRLNVVADA